jgi:hypothetical protein
MSPVSFFSKERSAGHAEFGWNFEKRGGRDIATLEIDLETEHNFMGGAEMAGE